MHFDFNIKTVHFMFHCYFLFNCFIRCAMITFHLTLHLMFLDNHKIKNVVLAFIHNKLTHIRCQKCWNFV